MPVRFDSNFRSVWPAISGPLDYQAGQQNSEFLSCLVGPTQCISYTFYWATSTSTRANTIQFQHGNWKGFKYVKSTDSDASIKISFRSSPKLCPVPAVPGSWMPATRRLQPDRHPYPKWRSLLGPWTGSGPTWSPAPLHHGRRCTHVFNLNRTLSIGIADERGKGAKRWNGPAASAALAIASSTWSTAPN